jgi:glycosyltransferase involved in cell wall biosynthesis
VTRIVDALARTRQQRSSEPGPPLGKDARVVLFTPGHFEGGGAARRSGLFASELASRGWDVRCISRAGTASRFSIGRCNGYLLVEVPGFGRGRWGTLLYLPIAVVLGLWWSRKALALLAIQVSSPSTAAAIVGRMVGRPFIVASTSSGALSEVTDLLPPGRRSPRRWLLGGAAAALAQTEVGRQELESALPGARVQVLPNPVRAEAQPVNGHPHVVYAGRFSEEKDLARLLDAWEQVVGDLPDAHLWMVGAGGGYRSTEHQLRERVATCDALRSSVTFTGWTADATEVMARHDIFVFPSTSEGMSNALLEATALGRVVVASDITPNRAVLGDEHPLLFPAGDTDGLTAALRAAISNGTLRAMARTSQLQRARAFAVDAVVDQLERILLSVADHARH